jgi:hypothetical protein
VGRAFGWLVALGLVLGTAGGAGAATLAPVYMLPVSVDTLPSVDSPPPASFELASSRGVLEPGEAPGPTTLMLLAAGLAGLVVMGHSEFA